MGRNATPSCASTPSSATTIAIGASAEARAVAALVAAGYEIVERNFRCKVGELDVIARAGDLLIFVEVRSRANADHGHAAEMVYPSKQRKVARVARYYLEARAPAYRRVRFDVVAITGETVDLIEDAWRV
jgi:putative endonuclease